MKQTPNLFPFECWLYTCFLDQIFNEFIDFLWLVTCFLLPKHGIVSIYACRFLFCLKSHIIVTSIHLYSICFSHWKITNQSSLDCQTITYHLPFLWTNPNDRQNAAEASRMSSSDCSDSSRSTGWPQEPCVRWVLCLVPSLEQTQNIIAELLQL